MNSTQGIIPGADVQRVDLNIQMFDLDYSQRCRKLQTVSLEAYDQESRDLALANLKQLFAINCNNQATPREKYRDLLRLAETKSMNTVLEIYNRLHRTLSAEAQVAKKDEQLEKSSEHISKLQINNQQWFDQAQKDSRHMHAQGDLLAEEKDKHLDDVKGLFAVVLESKQDLLQFEFQARDKVDELQRAVCEWRDDVPLPCPDLQHEASRLEKLTAEIQDIYAEEPEGFTPDLAIELCDKVINGVELVIQRNSFGATYENSNMPSWLQRSKNQVKRDDFTVQVLREVVPGKNFRDQEYRLVRKLVVCALDLAGNKGSNKPVTEEQAQQVIERMTPLKQWVKDTPMKPTEQRHPLSSQTANITPVAAWNTTPAVESPAVHQASSPPSPAERIKENKAQRNGMVFDTQEERARKNCIAADSKWSDSMNAHVSRIQKGVR